MSAFARISELAKVLAAAAVSIGPMFLIECGTSEAAFCSFARPSRLGGFDFLRKLTRPWHGKGIPDIGLAAMLLFHLSHDQRVAIAAKIDQTEMNVFP